MPATGEAAEIGFITRAGVAAAVALARRLGLPSAGPDVLSSRGNLLVHLAPAPIVARVATLTALTRRDPSAWLAREVAVAGYVAGRGGPAVSPVTMVPPGPYRQDGLAITLWDLLPPSSLRPDPAAAGAALAEFHLAAAGCPAELGYLTPARDLVSEGLEILEREAGLDRATIDALRQGHARVLAAIPAPGEQIVLHGDAHPGNLLAAGDGWRWADLEETCRGPVEWDLAVLAGQSGAGARAALRGYAGVAGSAVPEPDALEPFRRARLLEAAVWTAGMACRYPSRYRESARHLIAAVLDG
ncbi:MAG TPA: phosphotransferase [Streptosporangiaceae bacterium]|nr:phosphotransferase [Streptosporangiaceae bacterium]